MARAHLIEGTGEFHEDPEFDPATAWFVSDQLMHCAAGAGVVAGGVAVGAPVAPGAAVVLGAAAAVTPVAEAPVGAALAFATPGD